MSQVDPWEKAADCERALRITVDPVHREALSNMGVLDCARAGEQVSQRRGSGHPDRNDWPTSSQTREFPDNLSRRLRLGLRSRPMRQRSV